MLGGVYDISFIKNSIPSGDGVVNNLAFGTGYDDTILDVLDSGPEISTLDFDSCATFKGSGHWLELEEII